MDLATLDALVTRASDRMANVVNTSTQGLQTQGWATFLTDSLLGGLLGLALVCFVGIAAFTAWQLRRMRVKTAAPLAEEAHPRHWPHTTEPYFDDAHLPAAPAHALREPYFDVADNAAHMQEVDFQPSVVLPYAEQQHPTPLPEAGLHESAIALDAVTAPVNGAPTDAALPSLPAVTASASSTAADNPNALDALIDSVTYIGLDNTLMGQDITPHLPSTRRVGSKAFAVEGQNVQTNAWESVQNGQRYKALQAGIQLANRLGALNEIEFSEYVQKTQSLADAVGGTPDFPDMRTEVQRARELDEFASQHDAHLIFFLRCVGTAWSPGYINQCAVRQGFVVSAVPGRLLRHNANAPYQTQFVLSYDSGASSTNDPNVIAVYELKLAFDVAHSAPEMQVYSLLCTSLQALAAEMEGDIVDEQGKKINTQALNSIAQDVKRLYLTLESHDLAAGSPLARRLFS